MHFLVEACKNIISTGDVISVLCTLFSAGNVSKEIKCHITMSNQLDFALLLEHRHVANFITYKGLYSLLLFFTSMGSQVKDFINNNKH